MTVIVVHTMVIIQACPLYVPVTKLLVIYTKSANLCVHM